MLQILLLGKMKKKSHICLLNEIEEFTFFFLKFELTRLSIDNKPVLSEHSKIEKNNGLNEKLKFNAGRKYCRMLPSEDSAILLTCIKR